MNEFFYRSRFVSLAREEGITAKKVDVGEHTDPADLDLSAWDSGIWKVERVRAGHIDVTPIEDTLEHSQMLGAVLFLGINRISCCRR